MNQRGELDATLAEDDFQRHAFAQATVDIGVL